MKVNSTTIKVQCSLNYQVASIEAQIEEYTEQELDMYTQYLVNKCTVAVQYASNSVGPTHTQQQSKPVVQTQVQRPQYQQPVNNQNPYFNQAPKNTKPANTQFREFNGVDYKFCVNKNTGEKFWAICDQSLIGPNTPRYLKYEE